MNMRNTIMVLMQTECEILTFLPANFVPKNSIQRGYYYKQYGYIVNQEMLKKK